MDPTDILRQLLQSADAPDDDEPTEPEDDAIRAFWDAFAADEVALADAGVTVEAAVAVHERMASLGGALVPELGPPDASGRLMLAISADGVAEHAPWAEKVVAAAPALSRWAVRAFRPPKPLVAGEPCGPSPLTPDAVSFLLTPSEDAPGKLDLVVCLPDEIPPPLHDTFGFQLLDAALGERGVTEALDGIDFGTLDDLADWELDPSGLRPLTELPAAVRAHGLPVEPPRIA